MYTIFCTNIFVHDKTVLQMAAVNGGTNNMWTTQTAVWSYLGGINRGFPVLISNMDAPVECSQIVAVGRTKISGRKTFWRVFFWNAHGVDYRNYRKSTAKRKTINSEWFSELTDQLKDEIKIKTLAHHLTRSLYRRIKRFFTKITHLLS